MFTLWDVFWHECKVINFATNINIELTFFNPHPPENRLNDVLTSINKNSFVLEREKAMNVFRLLGDLSHLGAIIILLLKIWKTRSCAGISGKTQAMFALVFITRYLDLFVHFVSLYNTGTDQICFYGCLQS